MKTPWEWLRQRGSRESEWQDELDSHLAMRAEWNRAEGVPADEAHLAARRQFGSQLRTLEDVRSVHVRKWFDDFLQDVRLLFRSLPYPNDRQLVSIGYFGPVDNNEFNVVSSYLDWRRQQSVFQDLTSMRPGAQCDLLAGQTPFRVNCYFVEANFLGTLGIFPAFGRDFTREDDQPH